VVERILGGAGLETLCLAGVVTGLLFFMSAILHYTAVLML
jgi:hypothetical protein